MTYSIGQLAEAAGVARSTVRYYERAKLLLPDYRSGGNYREYSEESLERLKFIRSAQATGFSLHDVGELLSLTHSDEPPCDEVLALARKRLADVRDRLKELGRVEKALAKSLDTCCRGRGPDLCDQITQLRARPAVRKILRTRP